MTALSVSIKHSLKLLELEEFFSDIIAKNSVEELMEEIRLEGECLVEVLTKEAPEKLSGRTYYVFDALIQTAHNDLEGKLQSYQLLFIECQKALCKR